MNNGIVKFCLIFLLCALTVFLLFPDGLFNITVNVGEQSSGAPSTDVEGDMVPSSEVAAMLNAAAANSANAICSKLVDGLDYEEHIYVDTICNLEIPLQIANVYGDYYHVVEGHCDSCELMYGGFTVMEDWGFLCGDICFLEVLNEEN